MFFACLSGVVMGYEICLISSILEDLRVHFNLCGGRQSCSSKDILVTTSTVGSVLGKLAAAGGNTYSRKQCIIFADVSIIIGAISAGTIGSNNLTVFLIARILIGLGLGTANLVTCTYLAEISPKMLRGRIVSSYELFLSFGSLLGFSASALGNAVGIGWQGLMGLAAVPCAVQLLLVTRLPGSPRWLAANGQEDKLRKALASLSMEVIPVLTLNSCRSISLLFVCLVLWIYFKSALVTMLHPFFVQGSPEAEILLCQARTVAATAAAAASGTRIVVTDDVGESKNDGSRGSKLLAQPTWRAPSCLHASLACLATFRRLLQLHLRAFLAALFICSVATGSGFFALQNFALDILLRLKLGSPPVTGGFPAAAVSTVKSQVCVL